MCMHPIHVVDQPLKVYPSFVGVLGSDTILPLVTDNGLIASPPSVSNVTLKVSSTEVLFSQDTNSVSTTINIAAIQTNCLFIFPPKILRIDVHNDTMHICELYE